MVICSHPETISVGKSSRGPLQRFLLFCENRILRIFPSFAVLLATNVANLPRRSCRQATFVSISVHLTSETTDRNQRRLGVANTIVFLLLKLSHHTGSLTVTCVKLLTFFRMCLGGRRHVSLRSLYISHELVHTSSKNEKKSNIALRR